MIISLFDFSFFLHMVEVKWMREGMGGLRRGGEEEEEELYLSVRVGI